MPVSIKKQPLWKVTVCTSAEAEEAAAELLQAKLGTSASIYTNFETGITEVSAYLRKKPDGTATKSDLLASARRLASSGLQTHPWRVSLVLVKPQNWAESWKRHFKPLEIGTKLLVKPPWSKRRVRAGQSAVVIEPGLCFGTGQHPTTAFCLRELCRHRHARREQSFLDLGTGSGILAISATRLGYRPVQALDLDPDAVRIARTNARQNGVEKRVTFLHRDLTRLTKHPLGRFTLVCANLISTLLIQERDRILARLEPGGLLIMAGILKSEFHHVAEAYEAAGLRLERSRAAGEWRSGTWVTKARSD